MTVSFILHSMLSTFFYHLIKFVFDIFYFLPLLFGVFEGLVGVYTEEDDDDDEEEDRRKKKIKLRRWRMMMRKTIGGK